MNFNEFCNRISENVASQLGENYCIAIDEMLKNNGTRFHAIMITRNESKISPNIYLEGFYEQYCEGVSLEEITQQIVCLYFDAMENQPSLPEEILEFERCKNQIFYRLVHYEKNESLLLAVPHERYLDFAITYHCLVDESSDGIKSFMITNVLLEQWGVESGEVSRVAKENTPSLFPVRLLSMEEMLDQILSQNYAGKMGCIEKRNYEESLANSLACIQEDAIDAMYVISNSIGTNGASVLLYPNLLERISEKIGSSLFLLPSSVHEFILVPEAEYTGDTLREMVREVNETKVLPDEVLSDQVYYYDLDKKAISQAI